MTLQTMTGHEDAPGGVRRRQTHCRNHSANRASSHLRARYTVDTGDHP